MPINKADKKRKNVGLQERHERVPAGSTRWRPSTLAGITPYQAERMGEVRDKSENHRHHQVAGKHVRQETNGQDPMLDGQSHELR